MKILISFFCAVFLKMILIWLGIIRFNYVDRFTINVTFWELYGGVIIFLILFAGFYIIIRRI